MTGCQKLTINSDNVKHILSTLETANCYIESLYEGIDFNTNVTRARFENELAKVVSSLQNFNVNVKLVKGLCGQNLTKAFSMLGTG